MNAGLTLLYWQIGNRIRQDVLKEKRAEYGAEIVHALSAQLTAEFGRGFGRRNLFNMIRFAEVFPDHRIVQSLIAQLGWTHFQHIIYLDDPLKRDFYAEMCRLEKWNTRTLAAKTQSMLFERTALSKKPDKLIRQELDALRAENKLSPDITDTQHCIAEDHFWAFLKATQAGTLRKLDATQGCGNCRGHCTVGSHHLQPDRVLQLPGSGAAVSKCRFSVVQLGNIERLPVYTSKEEARMPGADARRWLTMLGS